MSDTLQERKDQIDQHQVNKSGTCVIPGCPCRGWSAQETANKTQFWVSHRGSDWHLKGAPCAQCDSEHQPAARGGGDEWRISTAFGDAEPERAVYEGGRYLFSAPLLSWFELNQIVTKHNQHQSLVAERERLRQGLELAAKRIDFLTNWIENSYGGSNRDVELGRQYAAATRATINQQRGTSE